MFWKYVFCTNDNIKFAEKWYVISLTGKSCKKYRVTFIKFWLTFFRYNIENTDTTTYNIESFFNIKVGPIFQNFLKIA